MRPTAMQRSVDKEGGQINDSAPPPIPPKHSTTIHVVCNGVRSSSSQLTSPLESRLSGEFSQMLDSGDGMRADTNFHISSMSVSDARKKAPPPVSPRDKHGTAPIKADSAKSPQTPSVTSSSLKSPPPILPRLNSGESMASPRDATAAVNANGHHNSNSDSNNRGASNVIETDFFSSLPLLPPDDYIPPPSPTPSLPNSLPSSSPAAQKTTVYRSSCPPQIPGSASSTIERKAASTTIIVNSAAPHGPSSAPLLSKAVKNSESERFCPPLSVSRKSAVLRPPPMTGIAENGTFVSKEKDEDEVGGRCRDGDATQIPPEVFYMNMKTCNGVSPSPGEEPTFAGRRDVKDPKSLHEKQIVSAKGTVRGFKNRVRAGIVTFIDTNTTKICEEVDEATVFNYREQEKGKIVVYTTSMTVVRETYDRCKVARNILQNHMVRYEERDLYMSLDHQKELRERLDTDQQVLLPQIFIDGLHLGGAADLEKLNESGQLRKLLQTFPKIQVRTMCNSCGGYRFVPCAMCHGSKKSVHRNNFTEEFCALRCMHCNENGLQRCQECIDQQE